MKRIVLGDNLAVLRTLPAGCARLVYIDPPFNTGRAQKRARLRTSRDEGGDRTGFQGRRYRTEILGSAAWPDELADYLGSLAPRLAGSGATGEAAARSGRGYLLVDANPEAVAVMARRLSWDEPEPAGCEGILPCNHEGGRLLAAPAPEASSALHRGHSGTIASLGHDSTQVAQSSHFSASMT